jgi:YegS/Rv2252/BmrU family lipid kinase
VTKIGVIARRDKELGGGLGELRTRLAAAGVADPPWYEISRSKEAPTGVRALLDQGVDRVLVWGGDGAVRRCIDTLVRDRVEGVSLAIMPAGTANLLAKNLHVPIDLARALEVALLGEPRPIDVGVMNGEHFAVMAGTGFDARLIKDADDSHLKERFGRFGYIRASLRNVGKSPRRARIEVDGRPWIDDEVTCVLIGNVGTILGGITAFPEASPQDGRLDVGVVLARSKAEWLRVAARTIASRAELSPFVEMATATKVKVVLDRTWPWEVDGGDKPKAKKFKVRCLPCAVAICQPRAQATGRDAS